MYKSPIDVCLSELHTQIEKQQDEAIYKAIVDVGINVDKQELIRALQYDRHQYEKGRQDAMGELVHCQDCKMYSPEGTPICVSWGSWTDPDGWCYKGERQI